MVINGNITKGQNNFNVGTDSFVFGGGSNTISQTADSVMLVNSTGANASNVSNFMGVLLSKTSDPASNSINLADSVKTSKEAGQLFYTTSVYQKAQRIDSVIKTSDFTVDMTKGVYYIDTSGGSVTATWDTSLGSHWCVTFKIIDATNSFIITTNSSPLSELFEGNALPYTTGLAIRDSITVHFDGTDLNII